MSVTVGYNTGIKYGPGVHLKDYQQDIDIIDYGKKYNPYLLSKPSDILMYAYENKIKKTEKKFTEDGKFCAVGVLNHLQKTKKFYIVHFLKQKYPDGYKTHIDEIADTMKELMEYSDSSNKITFKDCAEFMKERGF